jgi:guanylate kinase
MLKERLENNKERLSLVAEQISVDRERDFQKFEVIMNNKLNSALEALERKIATERQKDFKEFEAKLEARLDIMQESILSALNAK